MKNKYLVLSRDAYRVFANTTSDPRLFTIYTPPKEEGDVISYVLLDKGNDEVFMVGCICKDRDEYTCIPNPALTDIGYSMIETHNEAVKVLCSIYEEAAR